MFPPTQNLDIDARAISGITGSISIACWVIVFSPQIIVNFRRGSAEGLSLSFLVVWLLGDVFNVLGAVLQGVLPTMVILAIYYTLADIVLLGQCLYYTFKQKQQQKHQLPAPVTPPSDNEHHDHHQQHIISEAAHLSPATPLLLDIDAPKDHDAEALRSPPTSSVWSIWSTILFNTVAVLMVCLAGVAGWFFSNSSPDHDDDNHEAIITFDLLGQIFGYLCAVLYLASRIPQICLNYRRKTVEGLSLLFFLFACLGNLTYVISIISYVPHQDSETGGDSDGQRRSWTPEMKKEYWMYIAVNASWLLGSMGTLFLDIVIFMQFFWYRNAGLEEFESEYEYEEYESISDEGVEEAEDYYDD